MNDTWFRESWMHLMGDVDQLLGDVQRNAGELDSDDSMQALIMEAEQQRSAAEAALRAFHEQRHALLQTLDRIQRDLAVAGRPLRGEIS
jgi:uncharacterized protein CbrC (UPF0167 family)